MNKFLYQAAFVAGLAAIVWVASGYLTTQPLALLMTLLIGAFYLMGALELRRHRAETQALGQALSATQATPGELSDWLAGLPTALVPALRQRLDGVRTALPGPVLSPYLAGLLVLLGMLGTFLGMVVTLKGTGAALESSVDLASMRDSLAAPVKGLGLAFGTSVCGVAASAMLGLMSALARREREAVGLQLEPLLAGVLRPFTPVHQREQALALAQQQAAMAQRQAELMQQQAELTPQLVDRLHALATQLGEHQRAASAELQGSQQRFHAQTEQAYRELARSVDQTLQHSLSTGARLAAEAVQPVVAQTMGQIARDASGLHREVAASVAQQVQTLAERFDAQTQGVAQTWTAALAQHERSSEALGTRLGATLDGFAQTFEQRSTALVGALSSQTGEMAQQHRELAQGVAQQVQALAERFDARTEAVAQTWTAALAQHERSSEALGTRLGATLDGFAQTFEQRSASLVESVARSHTGLQTELATAAAGLNRETLALNERSAAALREQIDRLCARLDGAVDGVSQTWQAALAQQERVSQHLSSETQRAMVAAAGTFDQQSASLLAALSQVHTQLQDELAARDEQRLEGWQQSLETMAATLQREWQQVGAESMAQQRQICQTLEQTAGQMAAQAEAHARNTIGEISGLVQAASEAPRVAAEVVAELRDKLSDSMARDNAMLEERSRVMATLASLLDAVQQASGQQQAAIDALLASSADWLEKTQARFSERLDSEGQRLDAVAAQLGSSAVEVASLGEAFGGAVQHFGQASQQLGEQLQRIEQALAQSMARSDEQLAYYVAQAREVIDLSIMSQKQIVDDLQRVAAGRASAGSEG